MSVRTISAAWVRGVADILEAANLDAPALFSEAGLDIADLNNSDARFEPEKISILWELAALRSGNPAIGLMQFQMARPASFDAVAYVMMSCPNLLAGLEHLIRYLRIVSDAADIALHEDARGYGVTVELFGGGRAVPRQRIEFVMITIIGFCRWITGRKLQPLEVDLANPAPADLQAYADAFRCPLRFDAPVHRLLFSHADLIAPLPTSNPVLAELHGRYAGEHLKRLNSARTSFSARELIVRQLSEGDPLRADIAKALCMSERTLQRRLQEEGTSFHQLIEDTRREMAQEYLGQRHLTLGQTAYLLGFADQSNFFRACKRWFDMSPGEYRNRLDRKCAPGAGSGKADDL